MLVVLCLEMSSPASVSVSFLVHMEALTDPMSENSVSCDVCFSPKGPRMETTGCCWIQMLQACYPGNSCRAAEPCYSDPWSSAEHQTIRAHLSKPGLILFFFPLSLSLFLHHISETHSSKATPHWHYALMSHHGDAKIEMLSRFNQGWLFIGRLSDKGSVQTFTWMIWSQEDTKRMIGLKDNLLTW